VSGSTLSRPHPDHVPTVGRAAAGRTTQGALKYATTLQCSCGWKPEGGHAPGIVAMASPANGGKAAASHAYRRHLAAEGVT
jgi:hypothetical protein